MNLLQVIMLSNCLAQSSVDDENSLIDSLIRINHIHDSVILVSFGADAVTAINTSDGILLIDAGISTGLASKYRVLIGKEFNSNDFRYLINSHCHPDHYGGNMAFGESIVVGHENCVNEMEIQWKDRSRVTATISGIVREYEQQLNDSHKETVEWAYAFTQLIRYRSALEDALGPMEYVPPGVIFSDTFHLCLGGMNIEMIHFGSCHSESDILVFLPERNLLFTGDLFFKGGRPSINRNYIAEREKWIRAIEWIEYRMPER